MKNIAPYIIVAVVSLLIGYFITKSCSREGDLGATINNLKEDLKKEQEARESKELELTALNKAIDSLATVKQKIKTQIVIRDREIDEQIAKDSTKAIVQYRRSLEDNNELPSGTETLSYREIGIGAKLMAKVPKLELQINTCEQQLTLKDKVIADHKFIENSYEESLKIQKLETQKWQEAYDNESAWYHEDWLWFGGGVVVTTAIVFLTGLVK